MTHAFNLCSGPECEVREFTGKHQRLLTEQTKQTHNDKLISALKDVIVRVGSVSFPVIVNGKDVTDKFLKDMLACDKKKILTEVRQFSLEFQTEFSFIYKFQDSEGKKQEAEIHVDLEEEKGNQYPFRKPKYKNDEGELVEMDFAEYSEVLEHKKIALVLPRSGENIEITHLDGLGEAIGSATQKKDRSSHTILKMRKPVKFTQKTEGSDVVPVQLDLDKLKLADIEHIRTTIKQYEGQVDTEIMFEHPAGDSAPAGEKEIILDLLSTTSFFFSSGAI